MLTNPQASSLGLALAFLASAFACDGSRQPDAVGLSTGLARSLASSLGAGGRVDLRDVASGRWDRLGFFWYASPDRIAQKLGFRWDHPDAKSVDVFDGRHLVLFVVVREKTVVDHLLLHENELSSCLGSLVVPRKDAVFVVDRKVACTESELARGKLRNTAPGTPPK